ncbi:hypothetical protein FF2_023771 [Malus domestica]
MSNLNKLDFTVLEVSGRNYLKWVQDVKLYLTAKGIRATIEEPIDAKLVDEVQKAIVMIFIQRHIYDALQTEYLVEDDPRTLWPALADWFDHQKDIYLPEVRHDWQHFSKTLSLRMNTTLKFVESDHCLSSVKWTIDADLLKKTYLTFHATNIVL